MAPRAAGRAGKLFRAFAADAETLVRLSLKRIFTTHVKYGKNHEYKSDIQRKTPSKINVS
jgi:hypothetical protein